MGRGKYNTTVAFMSSPALHHIYKGGCPSFENETMIWSFSYQMSRRANMTYADYVAGKEKKFPELEKAACKIKSQEELKDHSHYLVSKRNSTVG